MAAGGMLGALAASSCCILPLVLFSLGVCGAWIGNFTRLAPYQAYFIRGDTPVPGIGLLAGLPIGEPRLRRG
jgi:mercuric ion transport protein